MCINLEKFNKRVSLLEQGEILYLQHLCFGTYKVWMNPQRNRIFREGVCSYSKKRTAFDLTHVNTTFKGELNGLIEDPQRGTSEKDISYLLMWNCGRWFVQTNKGNSRFKVKEV